MTGDLHCHTRFSDGSMQPEDLVAYARRAKISCVAITDHDTMEGVGRACESGKNCGVTVIPGVEVSTFDYKRGKKAHLICYQPRNPRLLLEYCAETLRKRHEASLKIIEKVSRNYPLDLKTVAKYSSENGIIYKQHIIAALMDMGYTLSLFGELFDSILSRKNGCAVFEPEYPDTREAVKLIRESGGFAVLAHPGVYGNFELIGELCKLGLEGLEVFHPRQSDADTRMASEAASRYRLLPTGGSDFHGMYASRVNPLGTRMAGEAAVETLISLGNG